MKYKIIGALALVLSAAGAAEAELEICNNTAEARSIAIGYDTDDGWISRGWWNVQPGLCATVVDGDLQQRYYYYRATAEGEEFEGEGYYLCTTPKAFDILGVNNCSERGYDRADFRKVDTGKTARQFTLSLADEGTQRSDNATDIGSGALPSGADEVDYVEPFSELLIFQGCATADNVEYCAFHGNGWKYYAKYDGPTSRRLLNLLYDETVGAAYQVSGQVMSYGNLMVEVMLDDVSAAHDADPYGGMRADIQGDWVSLSDPDNTIEVHGSEMWIFHGDDSLDYSYLNITDGCAVAPPGGGPVLIGTRVEDRMSECYRIENATQSRLDLIYLGSGETLAGRGAALRFRRP